MANTALLFHAKGEGFTSPFGLHVQFSGLLFPVILKGHQSVDKLADLLKPAQPLKCSDMPKETSRSTQWVCAA